jgi:phage replication initiation protein
MGYTLYMGSFGSNIYFCVYEKNYEQLVNKGISLDKATVKNRFEIRLMDEHSVKALDGFTHTDDVDGFVFDIINTYVTFLNPNASKDKTKWGVDKMWKNFIGEERGKLKLATDPKPYNVDNTVKWLSRQVAPTWKMLSQVDKENNTNLLERMIKETELQEKQIKIKKSLTTKVEDIVIVEDVQKKM